MDKKHDPYIYRDDVSMRCLPWMSLEIESTMLYAIWYMLIMNLDILHKLVSSSFQEYPNQE